MAYRRWDTPADFAVRCVDGTLEDLADHYGVSCNTIARAIRRMPVDVQVARHAVVHRRRLEGVAARADAVRGKPRVVGPVGVALTKTGPVTPDTATEEIRRRDRAFVRHFVAVCRSHGADMYPLPYRGAAA